MFQCSLKASEELYKFAITRFETLIISEYNQEIPKTQTAAKPVAY